jgi:putative heme iron utilization protein
VGDDRPAVEGQVRDEDRSRLREILAVQRLLALAVVVDGDPAVGLLPYAMAPDFGSLYVQASRLARHSRGLKAGGRWSGAIHEPDAPEKDPLQIPRVVLEGRIEVLAGPQPEFQPAARAFLARFPGAAMTLSLPDFALYRLDVEGGRLVLGFGHALNLSASLLRELAVA